MAVADALLLLLVKVWAIGVPVPELPPVMPPACATLQAYVAPDAASVKAMLGAVPLHILCAVGLQVTDGNG